jgi:Tfp pilus assembly protein PilX
MEKKYVEFLKNESGMALVIALVMMVVLTLIGIAASFTSIFEIIISGHKRGSTNAFYAADSGVQVTMANISNFDYVTNQTTYHYSKDSGKPNPTNANIVIKNVAEQFGAPRGSGMSATGSFGFEYYLIESTGHDQLELSLMKSNCEIHQKVVRLVPKQGEE